jgi:hypothetical protein
MEVYNLAKKYIGFDRDFSLSPCGMDSPTIIESKKAPMQSCGGGSTLSSCEFYYFLKCFLLKPDWRIMACKVPKGTLFLSL